MILSPSILSCDFNNVESDIKRLKSYGVKYVHLDVMDGVFVNNISFGQPILKALSKIKDDMIFDTHLMIVDPIRYIKDFCSFGSDIITFHYEATKDIDGTIKAIKEENKKVGISIKPDTDAKVIFDFFDKIDVVLVMGVNPGFGGQKYISSTTNKISRIYNEIKKRGYSVDIEVDGGITDVNVKEVCDAGANIIVSGSYIFNGDIKNNIEKMYEAIKR